MIHQQVRLDETMEGIFGSDFLTNRTTIRMNIIHQTHTKEWKAQQVAVKTDHMRKHLYYRLLKFAENANCSKLNTAAGFVDFMKSDNRCPHEVMQRYMKFLRMNLKRDPCPLKMDLDDYINVKRAIELYDICDRHRVNRNNIKAVSYTHLTLPTKA